MSDAKTQLCAQPLHWWTQNQFNELGQRLRPAWEAWLKDWVVTIGTGLLRVECAPASEVESPAAGLWQPVGTHDSAAAWLHLPADCVAPCFGLLFGSEAADARTPAGKLIADAVLQESRADLMRQLRTCLNLAPVDTWPAPAPQLFKPWGGAALVCLGGDGATCPRLLLNAGLISRLLADLGRGNAFKLPSQPANRPMLQPVSAAVADRPVKVRVELAPCELDIETLAGLRVGDIIPLPHALDVPLIVSVENHPLCTGFLGRHGAARAVELVRESSAATPTEPHHSSLS